MTDGFDELALTPACGEALERLRGAAGPSSPMERHCLRCLRIATELGRRRAWELDDEVLMVAAILHDIGLYDGVATGGVYTTDGATLARDILPAHGWSAVRVALCAEAIDRHHLMRSQLSHGAVVEALRLADLVDVSGGVVRAGLERSWITQLFADVPRKGWNLALAREVGRMARERPRTLPRIFLRG